MKKTVLSNLIKALVKEVAEEMSHKIQKPDKNKSNLQEIFRGFNFKTFKKIDDPKLMVNYAKKYLPKLGQGSGRIVFGLGSGKVLKIASPAVHGTTQNTGEIEAYTQPGMPDFLAKIYDFDHENSYWIVAEGVQVILDNKQLKKKFTPVEDILMDIARHANEGRPFKQALEDSIFVHNYKITQNKSEYFWFWSKSGKHTTKELSVKDFTQLDMELFKRLYDASRMGIVDIDRYDHWGVTSNGRLVIVDYGIIY